MKINSIFKDFATLLEERLYADIFTTEDSVRYTFFHALLSGGFCNHTEITLELPHPTIAKAKIDLFIQPSDQRPSSAFEFKYDRPIPSKKNAPRTQKAGAVFKDLFRLARIPVETASIRVLIYLASQEMQDYFSNPNNGLSAFYNQAIGNPYQVTSDMMTSKASTFRSVVEDWFTPISVTCLYRRDLSRQHAMRIFQVET
jgi:hypothetical protein